MTTREQERASEAWKMAEEGVAVAGKDYVNLAKAAPALIINNGLMQTLAFYESKGKAQHQALAKHLRRWVFFCAGGKNDDPGFALLMRGLLGAESRNYRAASEEAMLLLRWIRQFAAALEDKR